jgi:hypothetical protein
MSTLKHPLRRLSLTASAKGHRRTTSAVGTLVIAALATFGFCGPLYAAAPPGTKLQITSVSVNFANKNPSYGLTIVKGIEVEVSR